MKTLGDVLWKALGGTEDLPTTEDGAWGERYERAAAAVVAEYEKRTREAVWPVKDGDGMYLMSPGATSTEQKDARRFTDRRLALLAAATFRDGYTVRITRKRGNLDTP